MPDREKVIKGLECCSAMSGDECRRCPYSSDCRDEILPVGMVHLANDALELLKEQEPRVLTLEEARTYEVVWPEDKGEGELHPLIVQNNMNDSKHYKYGIHWRVWSAKPTDEQRKAVKWDE